MCRTSVPSPITDARLTGARQIRGKSAGRLRVATAAFAAFVVGSASTPLCGQGGNLDSATAPSSLTPNIRLTTEWDDNVFRANTADNPIGDFSTTLGSDVQASLRMSRLRFIGRGEVDRRDSTDEIDSATAAYLAEFAAALRRALGSPRQ